MWIQTYISFSLQQNEQYRFNVIILIMPLVVTATIILQYAMFIAICLDGYENAMLSSLTLNHPDHWHCHVHLDINPFILLLSWASWLAGQDWGQSIFN